MKLGPSSMWQSPGRFGFDIAAIGFLALVLYLPGFWWGAPYASSEDRVRAAGVDDATPLQPLADVHNIIQPKPDRNLGYPLMHSFVLTAAYSPYLGWLWLTGRMEPSPTYPFGLADPVAALRNLTLLGHLLSTLFAVGTIVATYLAGRFLWGRGSGLAAAAAALVMFPMFYYARTGNPDALMMFFIACALAAFSRMLAHGSGKPVAIALGVAVGFAVATKEQAAAAFLAIPFVLLALQVRDGAGWPAFWRSSLVLGLTTFVAFGIGSGLFVDPQFYLDHLEFGRTRIQELQVPGGFIQAYPTGWDGTRALLQVLGSYVVDILTLPGALLGLLGIAWTAWKDPRRALLALCALTYAATLTWGARVGQLRYLMPVALVLAIFAGRAVTLAWSRGPGALRYGVTSVAAFALILGLLRGLDLTHAMLNDSRYDAAAWLEGNLPRGASLEYFGATQTLPALREDIASIRAAEYRGAIHQYDVGSEAVNRIVSGWRERNTAWILLVPDHSSRAGAPHSATCPPRVFEGLMSGEYGYRLVAEFETPRLLPWVARPALDYPTVNPPIRVFYRGVLSEPEL